MTRRFFSVAMSGLLALPAVALAAEDASSSWALGAGFGVVRRPYKGMDNDTLAFPFVRYESQRLNILGTGADFKFAPVGAFSFRLRARYDFGDGYDASDSSFLRGMADRKGGFRAGAAAVWRPGPVEMSLDWLAGLGSAKGKKANLTLAVPLHAGSLRITPYVAAGWVDRTYATWYFGVRTFEARPGRPAYEADATVNLSAGVRAEYPFAQRHALFLDVSGTRYGSEIRDSPIVDRSNSTMVRIGYAYRF